MLVVEHKVKIKDFEITADICDEEGVSFTYKDASGEEREISDIKKLKDLWKGTKVKVFANCESGYRSVFVGSFTVK